MAKGSKFVYFFGGKGTEGRGDMKQLLGGKGANLADMCSLGLPVPPGFTITTEVCDLFYKLGRKYPADLDAQVDANIAKLEKLTGKTFGHGGNPLLVSVRSGAAASMPGMMDTVLNLGLNDQTLPALIKLTGNERFAWDAMRRFMQMFGDVVLDMEHHDFEHALDGVKKRRGAQQDTDLDVEGLKEVVAEYSKVYDHAGKKFPQNAREQLQAAINAVFGSWNNPRAIKYRQLNDIRGLLGTAVNVQAMVFGNMGDTSGTGVAFTRNPSTGENKFYGEYLMNAQGEDVVAGIRTPQPIDQLAKVDPTSYKQLVAIREKLEKHYRDMQDIEFTIERGTLYMLQTRNGKRTAPAAVRVAVDLVAEKLITEKEGVLRVEPKSLDQLLHPTFNPKAEAAAQAIGRGLPASPGAATGQIVFSAHEAEEWEELGKSVILVRIETSPEDIGGMNVAQGILTSRGGMTSHAAVVARGMGKCCVAGCSDVAIDYAAKTLTAGGVTLKEGDWMSLNGSLGTVYAGKIETQDAALTGPFGTIMDLADKYRKIGVRTNADTPHDTEVAVRFGAEGIGLCRTEHMFFEGDRILAMREMILAEDAVGREKALAKLLPLQRQDFIGMFKALDGRPATIRFLDPPLHEFVPHDAEGQAQMAAVMGVPAETIKAKVDSLHEFNPMLGHRGCRLGITYPVITAMQARAVIEAALEVPGSKPEIMIPLVGTVKELSNQKAIVLAVLDSVMAERGIKKLPFELKIGTMIEVPRGAVTADAIAAEAEFFSFGTNDLTQMGCGFSRDDAGKFLKQYVDDGIYDYDPFQTLDREGVGELIRIAVTKGKSARPNIKLGICGEHGGDPSSVEFCHLVGLNYVSCSPYRVPIARLAAAQAAIRHGNPGSLLATAKAAPAAKKALKKAVKKAAPKAAKKAVKKAAKAPVKKAAKKTAKKSKR
ncbi:MAG: pyruvate, phosphate dikinase [Planctomycetaceae bacterium]|nr:pyruvate, phosphate dikinase [Planctomycetaceae bacterium]